MCLCKMVYKCVSEFVRHECLWEGAPCLVNLRDSQERLAKCGMHNRPGGLKLCGLLDVEVQVGELMSVR